MLIELIALGLVAHAPVESAAPGEATRDVGEKDEAVSPPEPTDTDPDREEPTTEITTSRPEVEPTSASPDAGEPLADPAEAADPPAPAPAAVPPVSVDPAFIRAELLASRLLIEPAFTGVGLLIAAGISTAVTVGSGVGLAFIHHGSREECWEYDDFQSCYLEPRSWAAQEATLALQRARGPRRGRCR